MTYDEGLAERIRHVLADEPGVSEKKMFGGLSFLVNGNMAVAAGDDGALMFRRDPDREDPVGEHIRPQVMGERVMSGWLHVDAEGVESDEQLREIVERGVSFARTLPPK
ncbi:TfoX/Sxy family protein [Ornithinimicrobium cryptoxanthini]|uniref:TfoX/Sxy family protein n=1 Tax=Ornithinimicrobium cryptoxanthini TaxID=2934161 RepID=A0ABY4YFL9_9MICO|nr:TfoX/Sxy family protein [Ornithinimicrobium cryptoxanthini]USQ75564.1 TfoX/Sxy family protein [Ornithinimicrobium cryptoxanthini]